jgi:F0F1-type ATP synthase assembly protein I
LKHKETTNKTLKFMGLGTTMAVTIGLGVFGGKWLDDRIPNNNPVFTAIGAILGLGMGLYTVIKSVKQK